MKKRSSTKLIFVTGGVISSLGKGITAASTGVILKGKGFNVNVLKFDPYLNVDSGTMNPFQHGEVFVTKDGAETDLDLGHYERFLSRDMIQENNVTTGKVYSTVIEKERKGEFLGNTVQVVPHISDEIKKRIYQLFNKEDQFLICEIGGTVGDIESLPFLEAIRQIKLEFPDDVMFLHLTLIPYIRTSDELKTKPTQHSVNELRRIGIQPDFIACRSERPLYEGIKAKISLFCNVSEERVISLPDAPSIYDVPINLENQDFGNSILDFFSLVPTRKSNYMDNWKTFLKNYYAHEKEITVGIVGKYVNLTDSYMSIRESINHASSFLKVKTIIKWIESESLEKDNIDEELSGLDGILIPGGFGSRGIEGMINASKFARNANIPCFGICLGMQVMIIDLARNVLELKGAHSSEFDNKTSHPVVDLQKSQIDVEKMGGTQRLGHFPCRITKGTKAMESFGENLILERHRHRYEFNNTYKKAFEDKGIVFSGICPQNDLVEISELASHPFFLGCQFHPELQSRPLNPHSLFLMFIKKILEGRYEN
ncbi:CTP synthase [bacterium]|nr:CTP synthase [bacterium]